MFVECEVSAKFIDHGFAYYPMTMVMAMAMVMAMVSGIGGRSSSGLDMGEGVKKPQGLVGYVETHASIRFHIHRRVTAVVAVRRQLRRADPAR